MRWKQSAPSDGCLSTRVRKLDITAEDLGEEVLLRIIADAIERGDWRNVARKWRAAFKKAAHAQKK